MDDPVTVSHLGVASNTTSQTTYTFSSQSFGDVDMRRYIIVGITSRKAGVGGAISSVTIGGVTASITTQVTNASDSNTSLAGIAVAAVPTGTSGSIVVTMNSTHLRCGIGIWRAINLSSVTASDSGTSTATNPTYNLDIPANGLGIGVAFSSVANTSTWVGLTEGYDDNYQTNGTQTGASGTFPTTQTDLTVTATPTGLGTRAGSFASWGAGAPLAVKYITHRPPWRS